MIPGVATDMERAGAVRWLSRTQPILAGPSLGEMGLGFRGWRDDFLGDVLDDRYEQRTEGAARSTLVLQDGAHGGVLRLQTGNVLADYARLQLGITLGVGPYDTDSLDPDLGFRLVSRFKCSSTSNILVDMFALTDPWWRIHIQADTTTSANWYLRTDDNSGVDNLVDSGVAFDTAWHVHALYVQSGYAAHYLDGALINSTTAKIPTVALTAGIRCLARANAAKYGDFDYWLAIPE